MKHIVRSLFIILLASGMFVLGRYSFDIIKKMDSNDNVKINLTTQSSKPLDIYTIENLSKAKIEAGFFEVGNEIKVSENYNSYKFSFYFFPNPEKSEKKKTTGLINIPNTNNKTPVIIMLRGYVDQEMYKTGMGTQRASEIFAENDFITIAPDFLGYADSDNEAENIFESRFQTYITVLSLIKSLYQIDKWDGINTFIWSHSNGGQIALTVLEITQASYPTVLWAPVSKPFPYSILYYTDEAEDRGKLIRNELAKFEKNYDVEMYSLDNYFERLNAPIQIHQGTADDAVPKSWTDDLETILLGLNLDLNYFTYPGVDHNMKPSWNIVVGRDVDFYMKFTKKEIY